MQPTVPFATSRSPGPRIRSAGRRAGFGGQVGHQRLAADRRIGGPAAIEHLLDQFGQQAERTPRFCGRFDAARSALITASAPASDEQSTMPAEPSL